MVHTLEIITVNLILLSLLETQHRSKLRLFLITKTNFKVFKNRFGSNNKPLRNFGETNRL
jgi:hypothetical protein